MSQTEYTKVTSLISLKLKELGIRKTWVAKALDMEPEYLHVTLSTYKKLPKVMLRIFNAITTPEFIEKLYQVHGTRYKTHIDHHKGRPYKSSKVGCPECKILRRNERDAKAFRKKIHSRLNN